MKKFLIKYSWTIWLGGSTSIIFNCSITDWRWWVFTIPLIILVGISKKFEDK